MNRKHKKLMTSTLTWSKRAPFLHHFSGSTIACSTWRDIGRKFLTFFLHLWNKRVFFKFVIHTPIPDQKAWAVDAMTISWKGMFNYIFPPFRLPHRILHKIREDGCKTILIAPAWPRQSWFPDLLLLSCAKPLLPLRGDLLSQFKGKKLHQGLEKLHLHAWLLSGRQSDRKSNQAHLWSS